MTAVGSARRLLWGFFALLALSAVALLIAWTARDKVMPPLFNAILGRSNGFSLQSLDGLELSPSTLGVSELVLEASSGGARLTVSDLQAQFDVNTRTLVSLHVTEVNLTPGSADSDDESTLSLGELLGLIYELPVVDARIDMIGTDVSDVTVAATWSRQPKHIDITLREHTRDATLALQLFPDSSLSFNAAWDDLPGLSLLGGIDTSAQRINIQTSLSGVVSSDDRARVNADWMGESVPATTISLAADLQLTVADDLAALLAGEHHAVLNLVAEIQVTEPVIIDTLELKPLISLSASLGLDVGLNPVVSILDPGMTLAVTNSALPLEVVLQVIKGSCSVMEQVCAAEFDIAGNITSMQWEDIAVNGVALNLRAHAALAERALIFEIDSGAQVSADTLEQGVLQLLSPTLKTSSVVLFGVSPGAGSSLKEPVAGTLELPRVSREDIAASAIIEWENATWNGDVTAAVDFRSSYLDIQAETSWLPVLAVAGDVELRQGDVTVNGNLASDSGSALLTLRVEHDLQTGSGRAEFDSDELEFTAPAETLGSRFSGWPYPWDIHAGVAKLIGSFDWMQGDGKTTITGETQWYADALAASYEEIVVNGLSAEAVLGHPGLDGVFSHSPVVLTIDTVDVGAVAHDISARLRFDSHQGSWALEKATASLWGGEVACFRCFRENAETPANLQLRFREIDLAEVLALAEYSVVQGSGTVNGDFPFTWGDEGLLMEGGALMGLDPGGVIRYQSDGAGDALAAGNESLDLVTRALSNYHYEHLEAGASYGSDGDLHLTMRIEGFNPDLYDGQRVNLNLNLTDNIPSLLRSLQAGRKVADLLEEQLH